ncbi:hypothetical protein [Tistlia consotensis]|nr:hypothetical protein [Tistlia consotensis]
MVASGLLHLAIALFVVVGVPQLFRPKPPQMIVPIDIVNLDQVSELASLPAEQIGPVQSAEESKPVDAVDEVARPQQANPQPAPAVEPTPSRARELPAPEPVVQPDKAPVPAATEAKEPAPTPAPPAPAPAEPVQAKESQAKPVQAKPVEPTPQLSPVAPTPETPRPSPEPKPAETVETPPDSARPVPEPAAEQAQPSEDKPLMAGIVPLPTPPRPDDTPPAKQPEAKPAQPVPPPAPVRAQEPSKEKPTDDLLAGVLRNVDKNLKPAVKQEQQTQVAKRTGNVTQSIDLTRRAAALGQMIRGQMQRCWRIDPGARSAERLRVSVRVRLKPDGTLAAPPEFENVGQLADNAYYRAAAESARRAILECQPFRLPQEDYNLWQDLVLNFDPREMF